MSKALQPWEFLLLILSGWVNRHQQRVIDYLIEENRIPSGPIIQLKPKYLEFWLKLGIGHAQPASAAITYK